MQLVDGAGIRIARVIAPDPGRISRHGADILDDSIRFFTQGNHVVVGLRHFLAVETRHYRGYRQQRLRLRQDDLATTFEIAKQTVPVTQRDVLLVLDQGLGLFQRFVVAPFHVVSTHFPVHFCVLAAHLPDRFFSQLFEPAVPTKNVIKAAGELPRHLNMRHLVLADGDIACLIDQNIRTLQHRVTQETIGRQIAIIKPGDLILKAGHPLHPGKRRDHRQQQVQLSMLRYPRLNKQRSRPGVNSGREPVDNHLPDAIFDDGRVFIVSGQCMPVGNEEITLVLVLQFDPVFQDAMVMTQMQPTRRAHSAKNTFLRFNLTHGDTGPVRREGISKSSAYFTDKVLIFKAIRRKTLAPIIPATSGVVDFYTPQANRATSPMPSRTMAGTSSSKLTTVVDSSPQKPPSITRSTWCSICSRISSGSFSGYSSPDSISVVLMIGSPSSLSNARQISLSGTLRPMVLRRVSTRRRGTSRVAGRMNV